MSVHMHKTKCCLAFFFRMGIAPGLCDIYFLKSADLLCKQKSLQESKDRLKDLPVLDWINSVKNLLEEIFPTTPYKCILQPSSKPKRNIFLEVLAADSCKWDCLHSRMQTNLLTWGGHMNSCLLLSGMSNFLFNAFVPFWQCYPLLQYYSESYFEKFYSLQNQKNIIKVAIKTWLLRRSIQ